MNTLNKLLFACVPVVGLGACGGGDTADRLDLADPTVRFVQASPLTPNVTLYHGSVVQSDVTDKPYTFASNYFNVDMGASTWSVKTSTGAATLAAVSIDPVRGNKYTIVALPVSATESSIYLITDPYNKLLTSDSARLRIMNASFNAGNIDLYMTAVGADITAAGAHPTIAATAYKTSGPASGGDSVDIPGGSYQITITTAGTKTVLFKGQRTFGNNNDILLLSVPDTLRPGAVKTLVKIQGEPGMIEVPAS